MKYKGKQLEEITKGSLDYQRMEAIDAFRTQFPEGQGGPFWDIEEVFTDRIVVSEFGNHKPDEFWSVAFTIDAAGEYAFAAQPWPVVELTYQPATEPGAQAEQPGQGGGAAAQGVDMGGMMGESKKGRGRRIQEQTGLVLLEARADGVKSIKAKNVITAGVVNGNGRRYPAGVLQAAVSELRGHLHESAGQGRMVQVLGEAEHPTDKGKRGANLLETVIKWTDVQFDGASVSLGGNILKTSKGRDLLALMQGGVLPGVSLRGYGETKTVKENGMSIEEVTDLTLTGFDLVLEPSFVDAQAVLESKNQSFGKGRQEDDMDTEMEKKLQESETARDEFKRKFEEAQKAQMELVEMKRKDAVNTAIEEATKDLPYGELNAAFVESVKAGNPQDALAVKALVESKRKEWDALLAGEKLRKMGMQEGRVTSIKPVLEAETGVPEFARGAFRIQESVARSQGWGKRNLAQPQTVNERFAAEYLKQFDKQYFSQLMAESKLMTEAEQTSDLNLPYSVSRAIVAEAFPTLVATGIFDVQMTNTAPTTNIWYEAFTAESGLHNAISAESRVITALNTWYDLAHKFVEIGTVVVTASGGSPTYVNGTDYVMDYMNGRIMALATISGGDTVKVTYHYDAIREGEMSAIQQGKQALTYKPLTIAADRLATEISREAIIFSQNTLGYDAVTKTLASLARQIARRIDKGIMYLGLSAALSLGATNSGGDWDVSGANYQDLVEKIGVARVKVANRYYQPTAVICSLTNADLLANWDGFSQAGGRADGALQANGNVGRVKGLEVFSSTEMSDSYFMVVNRELVMHRIFQTLQFRGPFPSYSSNKLLASEQYYIEEFNGTDAPVPQKGAFVACV